MSTTLEGTIQRLALNQSSRIGVLDYLSSDNVRLWQGATAQLQCALFRGTPSAATLVDDVSNLVSVELIARKVNSGGAVLFSKTILAAAVDLTVTYSDWIAGLDEHFSFELTSVETNQTLPNSGHLPIYFSIKVTTSTHTYLAGFGYGEIVNVGITGLGPPVASPFIAVYTNSAGLIQNPVLNFTGVTVIGLADSSLTFALPLKRSVDDISINAVSTMQDGYLHSTDYASFLNKEPGLGTPSISGQVLSSTTGNVRTWITMGAGGGGTITLSGDVTGSGTSTISTTVAHVADAALSANVPLLNVGNVFTTDQTIDMGSIAAAIVDGLVMRNDTLSTNAVPLQNSPVIVFEAHGWDGAADHKWEMNEQFFTFAGGAKSKFLWQFYENEGASSGEVYLDYSGSIGATGYITSGFSFLTTNGMVLSEAGLQFSSANATIGNNNTTAPVKFSSLNITAPAWRFNASSNLTSGDFIQGLTPNSGFVGNYLKFGTSSNGATITSTVFTLDFAGLLTTPSITLPNFNTTNSQLKIGTFELQSYALGNGWFGDNIFYDGSNFKNRATGPSSMFYFNQDEINFRNYTSSAGGTSLAQTSVAKISPTGAGFGPAIVINTDVFTGSKFFVDYAAGNIGIGTTSWGTSASGVLGMLKGVTPLSSPTNVGQVWVASTGALMYRSPAGTVSIIGAA